MTGRLHLLVAGFSAVAMLGGTTELARADVLITEPARVINCGDDITVGVWYQSYSGGSRRLARIVHDAAAAPVVGAAELSA